MKIIVEIVGGCVSGVYYEREDKDAIQPMGVPDVFVVDLDGAEVGEETSAEPVTVEPLKDASDITIEAMGDLQHAKEK